MTRHFRRQRRRLVTSVVGEGSDGTPPPFEARVVLAAIVLFAAGLVTLVSLVLAPYSGPQYLYRGDDDNDDAFPVIEYVGDQPPSPPPPPPPPPSSSSSSSFGDDGGGNVASGAAPLPDFLNTTLAGPRVVEFYAPWCPHCRRYKPRYVQLAREVRSTPGGKDVQFYAVSCTAHRNVCLGHKVRSYPTIKLFRAGGKDEMGQVWRGDRTLTVEDVLDILLLRTTIFPKDEQLPDAGNVGSGSNIDENRGASSVIIRGAEVTINQPRPSDDNAVVQAFPKRIQAELFSDATLSFDFALRNSIFMSMDPLSLDEKKTFFRWIMLVERAVPTQMRYIHDQAREILDSFDTVVNDHVAFEELIANKKPLVDGWSDSCKRGTQYAGYTCGLWELIHIITVGIVEWNEKRVKYAKGADVMATADVADTIRNYVEHFFECEVCRKSFIKMYDDCEFDRCRRLSRDRTARSRLEWKELALWLWETHNHVNVRLLGERLAQGINMEPTDEQMWAARWPPKLDCPLCWHEDGTSNMDEVYRRLRSEYWPSDGDEDERHWQRAQQGISWAVLSGNQSAHLHPLSFIFPATLLLSVLWWLVERHGKRRSGKHKKVDMVEHPTLPV